MTQRPILVIAGDIGGARAIAPAVAELERRGVPFAVVEHRFLKDETAPSWPRVELPPGTIELSEHLGRHYAACLFGTSVADVLPLQVARKAQSAGVPVIAVLDNWMSYRTRLETDGMPMLEPDAYAVMDELARAEAIADGVPARCLVVVGHPGLASLAAEFDDFRRQSGAGAAGTRWLVVFISEPAEIDQGADASRPEFRGYTEKTVLTLLSTCLQPYHDRVEVGLVAHPRENARDLADHWDRCRGKLDGGLLPVRRGRDAVFRADAVCGMTSLLLLEALLLGKRVLSLQPGLRLRQLEFLQKKGLRLFVTSADAAATAVHELMSSTTSVPRRQELELHEHAARNLADLVQSFIGAKQ